MPVDTNTPAVEMKMTPEEFASLRARVAAFTQQDVHLGRLLEAMLLHLGHAHGLDPTVEDVRLAKKAREDARLAEDKRLEDEAELREVTRAAEDVFPRTSAEKETLLVRRAAEDLQVQRDAEALAKSREEEDARLAAADEQAAKDVAESKEAQPAPEATLQEVQP